MLASKSQLIHGQSSTYQRSESGAALVEGEAGLELKFVEHVLANAVSDDLQELGSDETAQCRQKDERGRTVSWHIQLTPPHSVPGGHNWKILVQPNTLPEVYSTSLMQEAAHLLHPGP